MTELAETERDPDPRDLGWSLGVILRAYEATVREVLDEIPHGHRGYQVLSEVVRAEQPSQLALAARLRIDRTVMTYLIDDLVEAGLVERRPNPADRRQRRIVATATGRRIAHRLLGRVRASEEAVLRSLDERERESLWALLGRVAADVNGVDAGRDLCEVVASWVDRQEG